MRAHYYGVVYRDNPLEITHPAITPCRKPGQVRTFEISPLLSTLSGATFALSMSRLHIIYIAFNLPTFDLKCTRN